MRHAEIAQAVPSQLSRPQQETRSFAPQAAALPSHIHLMTAVAATPATAATSSGVATGATSLRPPASAGAWEELTRSGTAIEGRCRRALAWARSAGSSRRRAVEAGDKRRAAATDSAASCTAVATFSATTNAALSSLCAVGGGARCRCGCVLGLGRCTRGDRAGAAPCAVKRALGIVARCIGGRYESNAIYVVHCTRPAGCPSRCSALGHRLSHRGDCALHARPSPRQRAPASILLQVCSAARALGELAQPPPTRSAELHFSSSKLKSFELELEPEACSLSVEVDHSSLVCFG